MTNRLQIIFSAIPECEVFADVGCDHGYIADAVLKSGKCKKVVLSDISAKCLNKAEILLQDEIINGRATAVVSNGLEKVGKVDCALIAGMGGMEIISILKNAPHLPQKLVLQPMKNTPELRKFLLEIGYAFLSDRVFFAEDKYYQLLTLEKGKDSLTDQEIKYGRDNVKEPGKDFVDMLNKNLADYEKILRSIDESNPARAQILSAMEEMKQYV